MKWFVPLIFLVFAPQIALAACINPAGVEGEITNNADYRVLQYCDNTNWIAMIGAEPYTPNAVTFDGTNDVLYASSLSSVSDSKMMTGSFWLKIENTSVTSRVYNQYDSVAGAANGIIWRDWANDIHFIFANQSGTDILDVNTPDTWLDTGWHHVLFSFDMNSTSNRHIYIDGVSAFDGIDTYTDDTINFDTTEFRIGSGGGGPPTGAGADPLNGSVADFWIDYGTYIDFSVAANREKFIDDSDRPVFLGATGALPTGSTPDIFLSGDIATWHTNKGTAGGFTEVGALTAAATYSGGGTQIVPSGLVGHWRLDETSGTGIIDYANNNNGALVGGLDPATDTASGVVGSALNFDGVDDLISIPSFDIGSTNTVTMTAWIRYTSTSVAEQFKGILYDRDNSGNDDNGMHLTDWNGGIKLAYMWNDEVGSWTYDTGLDVTPFEWAFVTVAIDPSNAYFYVGQDGVLSSNSRSYTHVTNAFNDLEIGADSCCGGRRFIGDIDDVRIYDRTLTPEEIAEIYAATDGIHYNKTNRVPEFFDGNRMVAMPPPFPEVTGGLVGHWKLDETSGTFADSSGQGNDGTQSGGVLYDRTGTLGKAAGFDGTDDYIAITDPGAGSVFDLDDEITLSAWVNPTDVSAWDIFSIIIKGDDPTTTTFGLQSQNANLNFFYHNGGGYDEITSDADALQSNEWSHVAVTFEYGNGSSLKMYVDGIEVSGTWNLGSGNSTPVITDEPIRIGSENSGNYWNGLLDDVRIYNRVLSAVEIQKLYNMGTPVGSVTSLPQGCPTIGDVCDDGTIYAGLSPDGNVESYTTPADAPTTLSWNNGNFGNWVDVPMGECSDGLQSECDTGESNTNLLVITDSDSAAGGVQLHNAAQYCYDLVNSGGDDWYLPADNELRDLLFQNESAIGGFNTSSMYWNSSEHSSSEGRLVWFGNGGGSWDSKNNVYPARCIRKGPAPRCANPYGIEGAMLYNDDYDVIQYCDGARWRAIGKTSP